jgi:hypothetical protein
MKQGMKNYSYPVTYTIHHNLRKKITVIKNDFLGRNIVKKYRHETILIFLSNTVVPAFLSDLLGFFFSRRTTSCHLEHAVKNCLLAAPVHGGMMALSHIIMGLLLTSTLSWEGKMR